MLKRGTLLASIVIGALVIAACSGGNKAADSEFPSFVYGSSESLASFRTAVANKDILAQMPCYCGCVETAEPKHKSLQQCFFKPEGGFEKHAAGCDLCGKEAVEVAQWHTEGKPAKEVRQLLDQKYSMYGKGTDTPPVTE